MSCLLDMVAKYKEIFAKLHKPLILLVATLC